MSVLQVSRRTPTSALASRTPVLLTCRDSVNTNLVVGATKIPFRMEQLASAAPNLHQILRSDRIACGQQEIRLPSGLHMQAVQSMVEFVSEGRMDVSSQNAPSVLECAELFKMDSAKKACERSLTRTVSVDNCIQLRELATQHSTSQLASQCDAVISRRISDLLSHEEFLNLPRIQVNVDMSTHLFEFSTDASIMEKLLPEVVSQLEELNSDSGSDHTYLEEGIVSLSLLADFTLSLFGDATKRAQFQRQTSPEKPSFFEKVRKRQAKPARKLILDESMEEEEKRGSSWKVIAIVKFSEISSVCLIERQSGLCVLNVTLWAANKEDRVFPKSPTTGVPVSSGSALIAQMNEGRGGFGAATIEGSILAIGGFSRKGCLSSVERYNFSQNSWNKTGRMDSRRARFAAVQCSGAVYAIGGSDGRQELGLVEVLEEKTQSWRKLKSTMITPRSCFGAAELDGNLYAIGGSYYSTPIGSSEVFDPSSEKWKSLPPMKVARSDLAVTSCNGRVYAIGGQKSGWKVLSDVESYDPAEKRWKRETSLNTARRNPAVVTIEDRIFVIGGYGGSKPLNSVEVFDPLSGEWTYITPMSVRRSNAAAVAIDSSIYVIGGFSGSRFLNSVECFDPESHQWSSFL